ncbi:hypothetical protein Slin15195_G042850 [Septoria linicola]|uniref:Uncharacterized protein n=1 Tax=Septoria linicola TaxID=215465 RepID=A0A9Q9AUJ1_9PEZI|nr:hypothetical protein Slin14017_G046370 [Septoria linicola]USW50966.1 hypothetical protein Slin15195_G042850 [Septoria linicola]
MHIDFKTLPLVGLLLCHAHCLPNAQAPVLSSTLYSRQDQGSPPWPTAIEDHWWEWTCAPQHLLSGFRKRTECIDQAEKPPCPAYPKGLPGYKICVDACWRGSWDAVRSQLFIQYFGDRSNSTAVVTGSYTVFPQNAERIESIDSGVTSISREGCGPVDDKYNFTATGYAEGPGPYVFEYDLPSVEISGPWIDSDEPFVGTKIGGLRIQAQVEGREVQTAVMKNPYLET